MLLRGARGAAAALPPRRSVVVGGRCSSCMLESLGWVPGVAWWTGESRGLSTAADAKAAKKTKKKKSSGEEGGDASKNLWYIKAIDQPPGPG